MAGEIKGQALVIEQTGFDHLEAQNFLKTMASQSRRNSMWPQLTGWLSATLFAAGSLFTGVTGLKIDVANDRRCLALQRDILSADPRNENGIALFVALGCRPQGEGSVFATVRRSKL